MKYVFLIICAFLSFNGMAVYADVRTEISDTFESGKKAYSEGKYEEAAAAFKSIIDKGYVSGNIYFNLGNAYFRAGDKGRAILNYERAKEYIPRDQDLSFNLRYLQAQVREPASKENYAAAFIRSFSAVWTKNELAWLCLFVLFLVAVIHIAGLFLHWPKRRLFVLTVSGVIVLLVLTTGLLFKHFDKNNAIILANSPVYFEPREKATMYFSVTEGEKVEMLKHENEWIKIRRKDGKMGWLQTVNLEQIHVKSLRGDQ
jgi:tetratricopeptide (TPR) repeat protein